MTAAEDIQRDLELSATETDAAAAAATESQKNLHTAMPGIIQSFDPKTQTAIVQPAIRRIWVNGDAVDLPPCLDVPVQCPRGGGFVLTFPVQKGDECLLVFSERAIDNWWSSGGTQEPSAFRMHDLSDAFAVLGFSSKPIAGQVHDVANDAAELRTLDGTTVFRLEEDAAIVGTADGAQAAIMGEAFRKAQEALHSALVTAFGALATAAVGPLAPLQAQFTAVATAITNFESAAATALDFLATKAKVG